MFKKQEKQPVLKSGWYIPVTFHLRNLIFPFLPGIDYISIRGGFCVCSPFSVLEFYLVWTHASHVHAAVTISVTYVFICVSALLCLGVICYLWLLQYFLLLSITSMHLRKDGLIKTSCLGEDILASSGRGHFLST